MLNQLVSSTKLARSLLSSKRFFNGGNNFLSGDLTVVVNVSSLEMTMESLPGGRESLSDGMVSFVFPGLGLLPDVEGFSDSDLSVLVGVEVGHDLVSNFLNFGVDVI